MKKSLFISAIAIIAILNSTRVQTFALNPAVTQNTIQTTICKSGWTSTIRPSASYTNKLKATQLKDKKYSDKKSVDYEEDHRLSLELGGAPSDPKNLEPQLYTNEVSGINLGAREKDVVESYLHRQVCSGKMTLKDAQNTLINSWAKIYLQLKGYSIDPSQTDD